MPTQATWDALHAKALATTRRGRAHVALPAARRRAATKRSRAARSTSRSPTSREDDSAGIITAVAGQHPRLAVDFVLAHLAQVNQLIDISGRSRFMQRLVGASSDAALIPVLEAYAKANLAASDRKPIDQAIDRIRFESSTAAAHPHRDDSLAAAHPLG